VTITLVILAVAVLFVLWRLSSVLGQDQGFIPQFDQKSVQPKAGAMDSEEVVVEQEPFALSQDMVDPSSDFDEVRSVLSQINDKDRLFSPRDFLRDAGDAFEMILGAFASGDKDTLSSFVSKDVYAGFAGAIEARESAGQHLDITVLKAPETKYYRAEINGNMAFVTLTVRSEQIQVTRDKAGEIVAGDPNQTSTIDDHWNFSRKLGSSDPMWTLIATQA